MLISAFVVYEIHVTLQTPVRLCSQASWHRVIVLRSRLSRPEAGVVAAMSWNSRHVHSAADSDHTAAVTSAWASAEARVRAAQSAKLLADAELSAARDAAAQADLYLRMTTKLHDVKAKLLSALQQTREPLETPRPTRERSRAMSRIE